MFLRLARANCANYSHKGPYGRADYCYMYQGTCLLTVASGVCGWFVEAVLPKAPQELQAKYRELWGAKPMGLRTCKCGQEFRPGSNRQTCCKTCSQAQRRKLNRAAQRKQRLKRVA